MKSCECGKIDEFLNEGKVKIVYVGRTRTFGIRTTTENGFQEIHFCPWCGQSLPDSLDDIWHEKIENLGLELHDLDKIPKKYLSDLWWREEGL